MANLAAEYKRLKHLNNGPELKNLWGDFDRTLTLEQKEYIEEYHSKPMNLLPPTFKFNRQQMIRYKEIYSRLDSSQESANKTIGKPFEFDETAWTLVSVLESCPPPGEKNWDFKGIRTPIDLSEYVLRHVLKYMIFDLEATRRETNYLKSLLKKQES